jgi:hypothetical protein
LTAVRRGRVTAYRLAHARRIARRDRIALGTVAVVLAHRRPTRHGEIGGMSPQPAPA